VRVRSVRERDSRLGLAQALTERNEATRTRQNLETMLRQHRAFNGGDLPEFLNHQRSLATLGAANKNATDAEDTAAGVVTAAQARWLDDKARLKAVEQLVERRRADAANERARRENN